MRLRTRLRTRLPLAGLTLAWALGPLSAAPARISAWVHPGPEGRLAYRTLPAGDRIMDFSHAGYRGGGVALPNVPVRRTVTPGPADGDDTVTIQAALDAVAQHEAVDGLRGAVLLAPGTYRCSRPLVMRTGGVVLRGSGSGPDGSVIVMTGAPHVGFLLGAEGSTRANVEAVPVRDAYVPAGADRLRVAAPEKFRVGDTVLVQRTVTPDWIRFMGMHALVRDGKPQTWIKAGSVLRSERTIAAIAGDTLVFTVPLSDCLDARWLAPTGATVVAATPAPRVAQIGIECLRLVSPAQSVTINDAHHQALRTFALEDSWVRDVAILDTVNSVTLGTASRRLTLERVTIAHELPTRGSAKPADFALDGSQLLLQYCSVKGSDVFFVGTHSGVAGPNVVLRSEFHGRGWIQPHMRWATGLLVDNCRLPEGGIEFMNRGSMGSGHGWTIGWAVAWNCTARSFLIQQPPGAANWAIGCVGERRTDVMPFKVPPVLPEGIIDAHGEPVTPASLYEAQLRERLGPRAVIGPSPIVSP